MRWREGASQEIPATAPPPAHWYLVSWISPPRRPAPWGPKALRKLFLPLPHGDRGGKWLSSPPSLAQFPRRQRTEYHPRRKGPQDTQGPQRSQDNSQLGDSSSKWSQLGNRQEYLGSTLCRTQAGLGTRAPSAPSTEPPHRGPVSELVSWTPGPQPPPEPLSDPFPREAGIFPRSSSRGISLTPQALQLSPDLPAR